MDSIRTKVQSKVVELRGKMVLLDCDLAELYQIELEQIRGAIDGIVNLPDDYCFKITRRERKRLLAKHQRLVMCQSDELQLAFPERGLYLLAPNLKSHITTVTSMAVIGVFTEGRDAYSQTLKRSFRNRILHLFSWRG